MKTLKQMLETFQHFNTSTQLLLGIIVILLIIAGFTLLVLAAIIPTASIGMSSLFTGIAGFIWGRSRPMQLDQKP
jgi:membrane-bound metal-dependent hydrolase YbcI (DUF457 family)